VPRTRSAKKAMRQTQARTAVNPAQRSEPRSAAQEGKPHPGTPEGARDGGVRGRGVKRHRDPVPGDAGVDHDPAHHGQTQHGPGGQERGQPDRGQRGAVVVGSEEARQVADDHEHHGDVHGSGAGGRHGLLQRVPRQSIGARLDRRVHGRSLRSERIGLLPRVRNDGSKCGTRDVPGSEHADDSGEIHPAARALLKHLDQTATTAPIRSLPLPWVQA